MAERHDVEPGTPTTGHEWDGIGEYNTPLPRWWVWLFVATIVWSFGYWVVYPTFPLFTSYTAGVFGFSSRGQVAADVGALQQLRAEKAGALQKVALADIEKDPALLAVARAQGKAAFGNNCAPCHGLGATGAKGYPNLNDDDWIWGGTLDDIYKSIEVGVRSNHPDTRMSMMIAFGKDGMLKRDEVVAAANYVRSLSGLPVRPAMSCRGRHRKPRARRAESRRPDLALRLGRDDDHRRDRQRPGFRHAGLGRPARPGHHQDARRLRALARRREVNTLPSAAKI